MPTGQKKQANGHTKVVQKVSGRGLVLSILAAAVLAASGLTAATEPETPPEDTVQTTERRGQVTNLPIPRYVSLKTNEGNVRRGPSRAHKIDWVFTRRGMPLMVTAEYGHWRRVQDRDGAGGWVHYALISGSRTVLVEKDMVQGHTRPEADAPVTAMFEVGVIAKLGDCNIDWCRISAGGYKGWVEKTAIWGVDPDEIRD